MRGEACEHSGPNIHGKTHFEVGPLGELERNTPEIDKRSEDLDSHWGYEGGDSGFISLTIKKGTRARG